MDTLYIGLNFDRFKFKPYHIPPRSLRSLFHDRQSEQCSIFKYARDNNLYVDFMYENVYFQTKETKYLERIENLERAYGNSITCQYCSKDWGEKTNCRVKYFFFKFPKEFKFVKHLMQSYGDVPSDGGPDKITYRFTFHFKRDGEQFVIEKINLKTIKVNFDLYQFDIKFENGKWKLYKIGLVDDVTFEKYKLWIRYLFNQFPIEMSSVYDIIISWDPVKNGLIPHSKVYTRGIFRAKYKEIDLSKKDLEKGDYFVFNTESNQVSTICILNFINTNTKEYYSFIIGLENIDGTEKLKIRSALKRKHNIMHIWCGQRVSGGINCLDDFSDIEPLEFNEDNFDSILENLINLIKRKLNFPIEITIEEKGKDAKCEDFFKIPKSGIYHIHKILDKESALFQHYIQAHPNPYEIFEFTGKRTWDSIDWKFARAQMICSPRSLESVYGFDKCGEIADLNHVPWNSGTLGGGKKVKRKRTYKKKKRKPKRKTRKTKK